MTKVRINPFLDVIVKINNDGIGIDYYDEEEDEVYAQGYRLWGDDCEDIGKFLYEHLVKAVDRGEFKSVTIDVDGVDN